MALTRFKSWLVGVAVIVALGCASTVHAQTITLPPINQPPTPTTFSFFDNTHFQMFAKDKVWYQRNVTGINGFVLGSPSFGLGQPTPSAVFDAVSTVKITGSVLMVPTSAIVTYGSTASTNLYVMMGKCNVASIDLIVNATPVTVNLVVSNNMDITSSISRTLLIKVRYLGTQNLKGLQISAALKSGVRTYKILWPNGDAPVFTKIKGKEDWIYLYWTGPNWPKTAVGTTNSVGEYYGIVSFNH